MDDLLNLLQRHVGIMNFEFLSNKFCVSRRKMSIQKEIEENRHVEKKVDPCSIKGDDSEETFDNILQEERVCVTYHFKAHTHA